MQNLFQHIKTVLEQNDEFCKSGKLYKNFLQEAVLKFDSKLLSLLLKDKIAKGYFFSEIDNIVVFDKIKFLKFISGKQFLPDSYTAFKNKIGLTVDNNYLSDKKDVVLSWAYKDCVLEGGQTKEDKRVDELIWNEILSPDEIDRLFEHKVLCNWKKIFKTEEKQLKNISVNDNLIIKGNNLLVLHSLKKVYKNKVKLIYIDPPYNTGKDGFLYHDNFNHSIWLTFMKNRLDVAKGLLKSDGVIFISIDINEQAYLKVLADEIFGRDNFVGEIIWETATDNNPTQISVEHEYVMCYAKNKSTLPIWKIKSEKANHIIDKYRFLKNQYKNDIVSIEKELRNWINSVKKSNEYDLSGVSHYSYVDDKGVFYPGNSANTKPGGYDFDIIHPGTKKVCKKPGNGYRWPERTLLNADNEGEVLWGTDENSIPKIKKRIETASELLKGYFYEDNRKSTKALTKLMGKKIFDNPKSINLLKKIIKFSTSDNDIILDFFAGSGSTAQAVIEVNNEMSSKRTFILCEQMDYINEVTLPRVQKIIGENNFVYFELASYNEKFLQKLAEVKSLSELKKLASSILNSPFISYKITEKIKESLLNTKKINFEEFRTALFNILDKNWLYIPYSEMNDKDFSVNDVDKKLTTIFYNL